MHPANGGFTVELAVNAWIVGSTQMMNRLTRDVLQPLITADLGVTQMAHALAQTLPALTSKTFPVRAGFTVVWAANAWTAGCTPMTK
jgi:hypothetical protein